MFSVMYDCNSVQGRVSIWPLLGPVRTCSLAPPSPLQPWHPLSSLYRDPPSLTPHHTIQSPLPLKHVQTCSFKPHFSPPPSGHVGKQAVGFRLKALLVIVILPKDKYIKRCRYAPIYLWYNCYNIRSNLKGIHNKRTIAVYANRKIIVGYVP